MSLTEIEYGSLASSAVLNNNFQFLQDKITELSELITSETSSFSSNVATLNNSVNQLLGYKESFIPTGTIIISQASEIPVGYLLCDGSEVKIEEYQDLYNVIGTTYGQSDSTSFCIPDLTARTVFGVSEGNDLGKYLEAGLPEIYGTVGINGGNYQSPNGCFYTEGADTLRHTANTVVSNARLAIRASRSSNIYGKSDTVQPEAMVTNFLIKY